MREKLRFTEILRLREPLDFLEVLRSREKLRFATMSAFCTGLLDPSRRTDGLFRTGRLPDLSRRTDGLFRKGRLPDLSFRRGERLARFGDRLRLFGERLRLFGERLRLFGERLRRFVERLRRFEERRLGERERRLGDRERRLGEGLRRRRVKRSSAEEREERRLLRSGLPSTLIECTTFSMTTELPAEEPRFLPVSLVAPTDSCCKTPRSSSSVPSFRVGLATGGALISSTFSRFAELALEPLSSHRSDDSDEVWCDRSAAFFWSVEDSLELLFDFTSGFGVESSELCLERRLGLDSSPLDSLFSGLGLFSGVDRSSLLSKCSALLSDLSFCSPLDLLSLRLRRAFLDAESCERRGISGEELRDRCRRDDDKLRERDLLRDRDLLRERDLLRDLEARSVFLSTGLFERDVDFDDPRDFLRDLERDLLRDEFRLCLPSRDFIRDLEPDLLCDDFEECRECLPSRDRERELCELRLDFRPRDFEEISGEGVGDGDFSRFSGDGVGEGDLSRASPFASPVADLEAGGRVDGSTSAIFIGAVGTVSSKFRDIFPQRLSFFSS